MQIWSFMSHSTHWLYPFLIWPQIGNLPWAKRHNEFFSIVPGENLIKASLMKNLMIFFHFMVFFNVQGFLRYSINQVCRPFLPWFVSFFFSSLTLIILHLIASIVTSVQYFLHYYQCWNKPESSFPICGMKVVTLITIWLCHLCYFQAHFTSCGCKNHVKIQVNTSTKEVDQLSYAKTSAILKSSSFRTTVGNAWVWNPVTHYDRMRTYLVRLNAWFVACPEVFLNSPVSHYLLTDIVNTFEVIKSWYFGIRFMHSCGIIFLQMTR